MFNVGQRVRRLSDSRLGTIKRPVGRTRYMVLFDLPPGEPGSIVETPPQEAAAILHESEIRTID